MDAKNSEILSELDDTLTDDIPTTLPTDLDDNIDKFTVTEDTCGLTETGFDCGDEQVVSGFDCGGGEKVEAFPDPEDTFDCPEDLSRDAAETEESVKALLEQERDDGQISPDEFSEAIKDGHMQISQEVNEMTKQQECSGCKKNIIDRFLLKALDQYWHEDCLKCSCCDCRLGEVGSTLFAKANLLLCRRDYLRLFGTTGYCSACSKMIPAFEMVMRAKNNVYHLECFACQMCNHRFCVGDRFYLCDNKILCEYDYEERMVFANMTYNYNALSQIKRQANSLSDDLSSGYGSPSPGSL